MGQVPYMTRDLEHKVGRTAGYVAISRLQDNPQSSRPVADNIRLRSQPNLAVLLYSLCIHNLRARYQPSHQLLVANVGGIQLHSKFVPHGSGVEVGAVDVSCE